MHAPKRAWGPPVITLRQDTEGQELTNKILAEYFPLIRLGRLLVFHYHS